MLRRLLGCCGSSSTHTRARRAARRRVLAERDEHDQAGAGAARRVEARLARRIAAIEAETEELLWTLMEQMEVEEAAGTDDDDTERLIAALPSFTTASWPLAALAKNNTADDCAVCLEPFDDAEPDLLRLLPACRHAFHAACIDTWLRTRPCPFCRSAVSFPLPPLPDVVTAAGDQEQEPLGTRAETSRRGFILKRFSLR